MSLLLALACSKGTLSDPLGSWPIETAFYIEKDGDQRDEAWLFLSSGYLEDPCSLSSDIEPERVQEVLSAFRWEGTRVITAHLFRFRREAWEGVFPLSEEPVNAVLDDRTPFAAEASWFAIHEVEGEQEGLSMEVEIVDGELVSDVDDGHFEISRERDEEIRGRFALESVDAGGRFVAERCFQDYESSIFPLLPLLTEATVPGLDGGGDTGD